MSEHRSTPELTDVPSLAAARAERSPALSAALDRVAAEAVTAGPTSSRFNSKV